MIRLIGLWLVACALCVTPVAADEDVYDGPTAIKTPTATVRRGVAASDDSKRDAAQLRAARPRSATGTQRRLQPSTAQRRCDGVHNYKRTIQVLGGQHLSNVLRGFQTRCGGPPDRG